MYAVINAAIYDFNNYLEDVFIIFDDEIKEIGKMSTFTNKGYEVIDAKGHLVMPSLIVSHTHIYSTFARGINLDYNPKNFQDILDQLWWKLDSKLGKEEIESSALVSGVDYIRNGVTTIIDHHASGEMIKGSLNTLKDVVCDEIGMRGLFCFETSDRFIVDECIEENIEFIENKTQYASGLFGMHASLSLSENTLDKISKAISNKPIHIHVAESQLDVDDSLFKYGDRVIDRLNKHHLLNKNSVLSHAIYINENEMKLIKDNDCYVALNVTSNMNNGVGLPDYQKLKENNVNCIIGNDGISSSITDEWRNLLFSMHHKYRNPNAFNLFDLKEIINNGYKHVNDLLGCKLGKIEIGYDADLLMIPYIPVTPIDSSNALSHIVFGLANSFKPNFVWCRGNCLVYDYKVSSNLESNYLKARNISKKLWGKVKEG